jgi:rhomboid protease GluP
MDSSESDPSSSAPAPEAAWMPVTRRRREADEWMLVLSAEGFDPALRRGADGYFVEVDTARAVDAAHILAAWRQEQAERAARIELPMPRSATPLEVAMAYALALSLLAFHLGLEVSGRSDAIALLGANRARLVLDGEVWRLVTALTLHSGMPHVLGNTLFGGFFLAYVSGRLGIGCATLAFVATGALGNLANDLYYGFHHHSVGASTGVFGLVGVLSGLAAWRRHQVARPGRGAWVAFAAGLGIVAMLGSGGPRVDVSAHVFGMIVGGFAGLALAVPLATRPPPGIRLQVVAMTAALSIVVGAWMYALST